MFSSVVRRLRRFVSVRRPANRAEVAAVRESGDFVAARVCELSNELAERTDRLVEILRRQHAESTELGRLRHKHSWDAAQARHETILNGAQQRHFTVLEQLEAIQQLTHAMHADAVNVGEQQHASLYLVGQERHETAMQLLSGIADELTSRFALLDELVRRMSSDDWEAAQRRHLDVLEGLDTVQTANARILQRLIRLEANEPTLARGVVGAGTTIGVDAGVADLLDPATGRAVLVSASNDNFLPLAKGLWNSVVEHRLDADFELAWIDIGHSNATREWLTYNVPMVRLVQLAPAVTDFIARLSSQNYHSALLLRPFLPEMFRHATEIVWIDSDTWVQDPGAVRDFARVVREDPKATAVVPILDVAYRPLFDRVGSFVEDNVTAVWRALYGDDVAREFTHRPLLSAGIFAMHPDNSIWDEWRAEIERHWSAKATLPREFLHVAEQTAFNFLQYRSGAFAPLDALHNFHANLGRLRRGLDGVVRTDEAVARRVGLIHLSDIVTRRLAQDYVAGELLHDGGAALSPDEIDQLIALARE